MKKIICCLAIVLSSQSFAMIYPNQQRYFRKVDAIHPHPVETLAKKVGNYATLPLTNVGRHVVYGAQICRNPKSDTLTKVKGFLNIVLAPIIGIAGGVCQAHHDNQLLSAGYEAIDWHGKLVRGYGPTFDPHDPDQSFDKANRKEDMFRIIHDHEDKLNGRPTSAEREELVKKSKEQWEICRKATNEKGF